MGGCFDCTTNWRLESVYGEGVLIALEIDSRISVWVGVLIALQIGH
jgi:hypothetical protein